MNQSFQNLFFEHRVHRSCVVPLQAEPDAIESWRFSNVSRVADVFGQAWSVFVLPLEKEFGWTRTQTFQGAFVER
jgi:hypothetical protein